MQQVVISWASLLSYGAYRFFRWTSLLSTWKGVGFATLGLLLVTLLMNVFILYSQAEHSATAKAARARRKNA